MCLYIPPIYIMEDTVLLILHLPLPFPTHFMLDSLPPRGGPYISHYLESFVAWFQIETIEGGGGYEEKEVWLSLSSALAP